MEIVPLSPDDAGGCADAMSVYASARDVDCPDAIGHTVSSYAVMRRLGWDGVPPREFLALDADKPIGVLGVDLPEYDNTHLAWLGVTVAPEARRRGIGSD